MYHFVFDETITKVLYPFVANSTVEKFECSECLNENGSCERQSQAVNAALLCCLREHCQVAVHPWVQSD